MATIFEAIEQRISCRAYTDRPVEGQVLAQIFEVLERINAEQGMRLQLLGPRDPGDIAVQMSKAMFAGPVYSCIACVCKDDPVEREKVGYYGEKLVLLATQLGLGTCWVASTYDAATLEADVQPGEYVASIIPIGYAPEKMPLKQRTIRAGLRAKDKPVEKLTSGDTSDAPGWFLDGVHAAMAAPTAVNAQPVVFSWNDGVASAALVANARPVQDIDLGICKLHFAIGSRQDGTWEWGSGGRFVLR